MNIKTNSKQVKKNDIFVCIHDEKEDRHKYIKDIKKASAIIIDKEQNNKNNIPLIKVNNTNDTLFQIYNSYYNNPLKNLNIIGITGTDGKTTTAYLIKEILNKKEETAYLGTLGFIYKDKIIKTNNTTVSIDKLLEFANILKKENIKNLVMEVSSEGLLHNRCNHVFFNQIIITNITKDHLNIHKTYNNYLNTKIKIINHLKKDGIAIINKDDNSYKEINKVLKKKHIKRITYGKNKSNMQISNIKETYKKTSFNIKIKSNNYKIETNLLSKVNVYNIVPALIAVNNIGISIEEIINIIKNIKQVPGRLNTFITKKESIIILDYAHTVNATKNILEFANNIKKRNIITVVGCAGGRDKEKRKEIGKIVTNKSNIVIFTMDDPRYEKVQDIIKDMTKELKKNNYIYIKNRKKAIKYAINISKRDDLILILGKGTDNYMAIKNKYKKYNDLKQIKKYTK